MKPAIFAIALATLAAGAAHAQAPSSCSYDRTTHRMTCSGQSGLTVRQAPHWNGQPGGAAPVAPGGYRAARGTVTPAYPTPVPALAPRPAAFAKPAHTPVCTHNYVMNTDTCR